MWAVPSRMPILAKVKEQMTQKLSNLRCPDHNQAPKLEFEGDSLKI